MAMALVLANGYGSRSLAAEAGTLDTLVGALLDRFDKAVGEKWKRADLALVIRSAATDQLEGVVRRLMLGGLVERRRVRSCRLLRATSTATNRQLAFLARKKGHELLLILRVDQIAGHLHLKGELRVTRAHLWRDLLQRDRGSVHHLHASARIDAEIRAYLTPAAATNTSRYASRRLSWGRRHVLAIATGDLDGDGRSELVVLRPNVVEVMHVVQGHVRVKASLNVIAPYAPVMSRRHMGSLQVVDADGDGRAEIYLKTNTFESGFVVTFDGKKLVQGPKMAGYPLSVEKATPPAAVLGQTAVGRDYFAPLLLSGLPSPEQHPSKPHLAKQSVAFYDLKRLTIRTKNGATRWSALVDLTGRISLHRDLLGTEVAAQRSVGHAFDLLDLDDDGIVELALSSGSESRTEDTVALYKLSGARLVRVWQSAKLEGRITAIGHGDLDGDGRIELFVATYGPKGMCRLLWLQ